MNSEKAEKFLRAWDGGQSEFRILTSGSTGVPKEITLHRHWMQWSAEQTASIIHINSGDAMFCCLPVNKIGGMMMLVRARVWGIPVEVVEPASNPLKNPVEADIISMTPHQMYSVLNEKNSAQHLLRFREILIGGGELSDSLEKQLQFFDSNTRIRHSYGMTESYSHIALRDVNGPLKSIWFKPFPSVSIRVDASGVAIIKAPFSDEGIRTNDLIETDPILGFKVIGRTDFIINSGGVKLHPEIIEKSIHHTLSPQKFFILSSQKDTKLGEILVLVCENPDEFANKDLGFLRKISPYAIPKKIIKLYPFPLNSSGKIDRLKIREIINQ